MLKMSEKSKSFVKKYLPDYIENDNCRAVLLALYDLIMQKGFYGKDEFEGYNAFGEEAQEVYDDIYDSND